MGRKSTIEKLPDSLKKALGKLLQQPQTTVDDATAYINKLVDDKISRSAVGRYKLKINKIAVKLNETREVASAVVKELGEDANGDVGKLLIEQLRTLLFDVAQIVEDEHTEAWKKVSNIQKISDSIKNLEIAASHSLEREAKIRKMVVSEAEEAMKQVGVDKDKIKEALEKMYGVINVRK